MLCWENLNVADRLNPIDDVMGVYLAMDLLVLDLVDLRSYRFLRYCCERESAWMEDTHPDQYEVGNTMFMSCDFINIFVLTGTLCLRHRLSFNRCRIRLMGKVGHLRQIFPLLE